MQNNKLTTLNHWIDISILILVLLLLQNFQNALFFQRDGILNQEIWRIATGSWVHLNTAHLIFNVVGIILFNLFFYAYLSRKELFISLILLSFTVGIGLFFLSPHIEWYVGFSGVLYGLFTIGIIKTLKQKNWLLGIGFGVLLVAKFIEPYLELASSPSLITAAPVIHEAHLYGSLGGMIIGIIFSLSEK